MPVYYLFSCCTYKDSQEWIIPAETQAAFDHLKLKNGMLHSHMNTTFAVLKAEFQKQKDCNFNGYEEAFLFGWYTQ